MRLLLISNDYPPKPGGIQQYLGTFVAAYLMNKGHSLRAAIRKMKHTPSLPMSSNQWDLLERCSEKLGVSRAGIPELKEEVEQPSDSFFKKWEAMLDWFKE